MALRKAAAYSKKTTRPFTRTSRSKRHAYIKTVPVSKLPKFNFGTYADYRDGKHTYAVRILTEERILLRDNALEAARMALNKQLEEKVPGQFYMAVKVFPHHMLRENKLSAGAGADRLSTGMTHSYGVVIGRAAIANAGKEIFFVSCSSDKAARVARDAMISIKSKLPCKTRIVFEQLK